MIDPKAPMKIVKIIQSLDFGGIERVFEVVAKYDLDNRANVAFLVLGKGGAAEFNIRDLGYRVTVLNGNTRIPNGKLLREVYRYLTAEKPDVVHTTGAEANFHGIVSAWLAKVPVRIAEEIGMPAHSRMAQFVFRQVFKLADKVIAVAGPVKQFLEEKGEAPPDKLVVIHNPVDVRIFLKGRIADRREGRRIISVCRLHPIKNLACLIRAFSVASGRMKERTELWLVGDGEERENLERLSRELEVDDKVVFWGYRKDPEAYLSEADLFILPSLSEGHPVSVIEAMLSCLPCVVTKVGGAPELIEDGTDGWLMDPKDPYALADLLVRVLEMRQEELSRIGERGRDKVLERFRPETYLAAIYSLYMYSYRSNKE
jgi:glycosyltransferase involved in cell wall biosynthesis